MTGTDDGERGARLDVVCPRCGWTGPPQASRLVTCSECQLSFDATRVPEPSTRPAQRQAPGTHGTFRAPSMGVRAQPFPITGPGTCELGDDYVTVSGFRTRGAVLRFFVVMAGVVLAIGTAILLDEIGFPDKLVAFGAAGVFLIGAFTPLPPSRLAVRFRIPYDKIREVTLSERSDRTLVIQVRDFAPHGEIYFATTGAFDLLRDLSSRRSTYLSSRP